MSVCSLIYSTKVNPINLAFKVMDMEEINKDDMEEFYEVIDKMDTFKK